MYKYIVISAFALLKLSSYAKKDVLDLAYNLHEPLTEKGLKKSEKLAPIIILHGLLGSKSNWKSYSVNIANETNRKVYSLDVRNHGDSPHSDHFKYPDLVADVVYFSKRKKIKKAIFIGHSLGGKIVMLLALKHPKLVLSLIVVDISPKGISPSYEDVRTYIKSMRAVKFPSSIKDIISARKEAANQLQDKITNMTTIQFLITNLVEDRPRHFKWKPYLKGIYKNFKHIGNFDCDVGKKPFKKPTLFIAGGTSDYITVKNYDLIKKLFSDVEIVHVVGAGHWVHVQAPLEFLFLTTEFINEKNKE